MQALRRLKKGLAILLTAAMVVGLMPGTGTLQAQAEELGVAKTSTTTKTIAGLGTSVIVDPTAPANDTDAWKGSYVYYGNYDADGDGTAEPVKYRVLDASTTDYSADGATQTMFLDCDSILYYQKFDSDDIANEDGKNANDWSISDVKSSLNGDGFLNKAGVFTSAEKKAIAASTVEAHALTTDSETGVNVASWTKNIFVNYVALTGEQIFLLDAEDVSNGAYGYSMTDVDAGNRKKTGSYAPSWWLRSADNNRDSDCIAGYVPDTCDINHGDVFINEPGVSPALNLNLSSVLFSSANTVSKSSALTSGSTEIGTEANTDWKLTLKDTEKSVKLTEGRSVTKASDGTITVPYTYKDKENATEKVNQISVMITDKAYDAEKVANAQEAQILYYGALQDIKNAEGNDSTVAETSTGTGTFALPSGLIEKVQGEDYHIYLLAEHVNDDNNTDYASEPLEVEVKTLIETVTVPSIDTPIAEQPLKEEITVSSEGVAGKATYKVTTSDVSNGTVTYVAPTDAKATTVTIPDTVVIDGMTYKVTAIEKNAFKNNKYIKKVIIGNNIITIGDNAFYGCKKLKNVKFGKNVKIIGNKAFYKCSALTKITIPSKVKTIGKSAFEGCKKLKTVTIGKSVTKTPKKMTVKVPKKKFKAYKSMLIKRGISKKAKFKKI